MFVDLVLIILFQLFVRKLAQSEFFRYRQTVGNMAANQNVTKKKKAVIGGIFKAELNNFLMKELAEDGYSGVEVNLEP